MIRLARRALLLTVPLFASVGCDDTSVHCDVTLSPSSTQQDDEALQNALLEYGAGATICLEPGTYHLDHAVTIGDDDVTLRGLGRIPDDVSLDFTGQAAAGAAGGESGLISLDVNGVTLRNFHVHDTAGDAIKVLSGDRVVFRDVHVSWTGAPSGENGAYGLYPVQSTNVLIEGCEVQGASDAGLYVGQSQNVIVRDSEVYESVAGVEIENTIDAEVYGVHAHDNTGGILVFDLPGLVSLPNGHSTRVHDNLIENNNHPNFASSGWVQGIPPGTGIMVLAGNGVEVDRNTVRGNDGVPVLIVSEETAELLAGITSSPGTLYDPYVETVYFHDNVYVNNGTLSFLEPSNPLYVLISLVDAEDPGDIGVFETIVWDGLVDPAWSANDLVAKALCIGESSSVTFRNLSIENVGGQPNFAGTTTDRTPHDCTHPSLPRVVLDLDP